MSRRKQPLEAGLDRLLAYLRAPEAPRDLAARIVARTTRLPQQIAREKVLGLVPPAPETDELPERRPFGVWRIVAGIGGLAIAASLALIVLPLLKAPSQPFDHTVAEMESAVPFASASLAARSGGHARERGRIATKVAPHHRKASASPPQEDGASELAQDEPAPVETATLPPVMPLVAATAPANVAPAPIVGPRAPAQGPPVPIDMQPAGSRATLGYGVTGGGGPPH